MKTFRLIGLVLFAIFMCVNLASCGESDNNEPEVDNESGVVINEKKLVEIKSSVGHSDTITYRFIYDNNNKLELLKRTYNNTVIEKITWNNGILKEGDDINYHIQDGLIRWAEFFEGKIEGDATFTYNSSKQITSFEHESYNNNTYTWENNKIISLTSNKGKNSLSITNNKKECKGYNPFMAHLISRNISILDAHPELAGIRTKQLPDKIIGNKDKLEFSYTFTKDGYIETCTFYYQEGNYSPDKHVYIYKWE